MEEKKKKLKLKGIIMSIILLIFLGLFGFYLYKTYKDIEIDTNKYKATRSQSTIGVQTVEKEEEKSKTISDVIEETNRKVVGISKLKEPGSIILSKSAENEMGLGTGIIVTENGYILSNEHVTGGKYSRCYVTAENGNNYEGTVVWSDSDIDLSITKINAKNLEYVKLGDSSKIRIAETVYAIGNPIGFEFRRTVTSGIISARNRTIKIEEKDKVSYMTNLIQTDATINPGNSGGPLIYPNGDVIGINTVKISTAEGIGFAIPINIVKPILDSFIKKGKFEEATIGIYAYDKEVVPYIDSNYKINFDKGIYVAQIIKDGPAYNTDLKEGDIIRKVDDLEISTMNDLRQYIYTKRPNDEVYLVVTRGKISRQIKVTLGER